MTSSRAHHEVAKGQLRRKKKRAQIRRLNENCNYDLKNLLKGTAVVASIKRGPVDEFYAALMSKGMLPEMAGRSGLSSNLQKIQFPWKATVYDSAGCLLTSVLQNSNLQFGG